MTRAVFQLAWPAVVEQTLIAGVDLTDLFIVGHLGAAAISAVGLTGQVVMLSLAVFGAVAVGCMAIVARQIGAGERAEAGRTLQQSLLAGALLGVVTGVLAWVFASDILRALGAEPDVVELGTPFMRVIALSLPLTSISLVGNSAMRAAGDTRTPMNLTGLQLVLNAVLGLALVYGPLRLGVLGSGIATMIARSTLGVMVLWLLWRSRGGLHMQARHWKPDLGCLKRIFNVGLPAGAEQVLLQFALLSLATVIAGLGTVTYAAHNVSVRIMSLSYMPGWGFAVAATTLVGQGLGAGDPGRARESAYAAHRLALGVMLIMAVVMYTFAGPILGVFTNDAAVIAASIAAIHIAAFAQPFMATSFVFMGSLRGAGDTRTTLLITVASIWTVRLSVAYLGARVLGWGLAGAWLGILADFATRGLFGWLRFRSGKWQSIKV
jgi:putative MATE family efflux protein